MPMVRNEKGEYCTIFNILCLMWTAALITINYSIIIITLVPNIYYIKLELSRFYLPKNDFCVEKY